MFAFGEIGKSSDAKTGQPALTPGTNLLAFCAGVGWMARRWTGAAVALVAASLPCSMLAVVATHFYELWQGNRLVAGLLRGALAAAVAIMITTAWTFARPELARRPQGRQRTNCL